jgi:hypothetical protein
MIYSMPRGPLLAIVALFLAAPAALAQIDVRTERVQFERGASSAVIEDSITGYETMDYVLGAREGQYMNVSMATDNTANYFNIRAPRETEVAFFNGSVSENQYEGILPESGDYRIRVCLMRSAARRDELANYRVEMIIAAGEKKSTAAGPEPEIAAADVPAAPEDGGPRHWEVTGVSNALNLREQLSTSAPTIGRYAPRYRPRQSRMSAGRGPGLVRCARAGRGPARLCRRRVPDPGRRARWCCGDGTR